MSNDCFAKFNFSLNAHIPKSLQTLGEGDKDDRELFKVDDIPVFELEHRPQFVYTPIKKECDYYSSSARSQGKASCETIPVQPEIRIKREVFDDIIHVSDTDTESDTQSQSSQHAEEKTVDGDLADKMVEIVLSDSDSEAPPSVPKEPLPYLFYKIKCVAALASSRSVFVNTPICLIIDNERRRVSFRWVQNVTDNKEFASKSIEDMAGDMDLTTTMWSSVEIIKMVMEFKKERSRPLYIRFSQNSVLNLREGDYFSSDGLLFLPMHDVDSIIEEIRNMKDSIKFMDETSANTFQDKQVKWVLGLCCPGKPLDYSGIKNNVLKAFFLQCSKESAASQARAKPSPVASPVRVIPGWMINNTYLDECCLSRLEPTSYLDDSIIDFFVQFIYRYVMCERQRQDWHIMNCFFLKKLSQYKSMEEAYKDTRRWMKNAKRPMPYKKYIMIPVNLHGTHWSLAIICHPYKAIRQLPVSSRSSDSSLNVSLPVSCFDFDGFEIPSPDEPCYLCPDTISDLTSEHDSHCNAMHKSWCYNYFNHKTFENDVNGDCISVNSDDEPYHAVHRQHTHQLKKIEKAAIVYLDSLEGSYLNSKTLVQLRDHLYYEFQSRKSEFSMDQFEFSRSKQSWQYTHVVDIPKQQNGYDCGIFLIEYIIYLSLNPQVIELQLLLPAQDVSSRLRQVPCCDVCKSYLPNLLEKKLKPGPSMFGCKCIDIAKRTWFTQEHISQRRTTLISLLEYMRENPEWAEDEERIEYLVDKLIRNYTSNR